MTTQPSSVTGGSVASEGHCESCYWYESNGLKGEDAAEACRSPKWEWTEEELEEHRKRARAEKNPWYMYSLLPDFDKSRHCDYKFCKPGESYVDVKYGQGND